MASDDSSLPDISWLIKGITLNAKVWNIPTLIDANCDTYEYSTNSDSITQKKKTRNGDNECGDDDSSLNETTDESTRNFKEGETPFGEVMKIFAEIGSRQKIGRLVFEIDSSLDKQFGPGFLKNMVSDHLKNADFDVCLLELHVYGWDKLDITPFLELIQFQHLIITANEQPLLLNEKILKCGVLFLDIPILNVEELERFEGFALLLGKREKNNFSLDLVCEKVQKYLDGIPSKLEFFTVSDLKKWVTDDITERLKSYSVQDDDFPKPKCKDGETILRLDGEDNAAILIRGGQNVVFARNGWRKWQELLETLNLGF